MLIQHHCASEVFWAAATGPMSQAIQRKCMLVKACYGCCDVHTDASPRGLVNKMFSGLISAWTTPLLCISAKAPCSAKHSVSMYARHRRLNRKLAPGIAVAEASSRRSTFAASAAMLTALQLFVLSCTAHKADLLQTRRIQGAPTKCCLLDSYR